MKVSCLRTEYLPRDFPGTHQKVCLFNRGELLTVFKITTLAVFMAVKICVANYEVLIAVAEDSNSVGMLRHVYWQILTDVSKELVLFYDNCLQSTRPDKPGDFSL